MSKLTLRLEDLAVDTFHTAADEREKGTVFAEQCTCYTNCTCPGCPTCNATCPQTCWYTCDDDTCWYTCQTCQGQWTCWESCGGGCDTNYDTCRPCMV